jgi:PASTA domain
MAGRGIRMLAVIFAVGSWIGACSSQTSSPSSDADTPGARQGMNVHPSMSASGGPEAGESFASPPASAIPAGTRVPDVRRMEFEDAVIALRKLGMDFGFVSARKSAARRWVVIEQWPKPGAHPPSGRMISMIVSMGPDVGGLAGVGAVACKPEEDDIDEPYCLGKLFRY